MLANPKLGQEVIYSSKVRNIYFKRAIVAQVDGACAVRIKEDGDIFFVDIEDEIENVRGT